MLLATLLLIEGRKKWPIEKRKERNWSPRNYASYLYEYFSSPVVERWRSFKKRGERRRGEGSRENGRVMHDRGELSCWAEHRYDQFFFFLSRFLPLPFDRICYLYIYIYICMGIWLQDFFIEENLWEKEKRNSGCEKSLIINLSLDLFFFFSFSVYIFI